MEPRRWTWAIVAGTAMVAALALLAGLILTRDLGRPHAELRSESAHIGENVDYALLYGPIGPIDAASYAEIAAQLQPSAGRMPLVGFRHYDEGALWYRFTVPSLKTEETRWNIRLVDYRAIAARLIIVEPD